MLQGGSTRYLLAVLLGCAAAIVGPGVSAGLAVAGSPTTGGAVIPATGTNADVPLTRAGAGAAVTVPASAGDGSAQPWTRQRMAEAVPMPSPDSGMSTDLPADPSATVSAGPVASQVISDPSAAPFSAHGRLFFSLNGVDYVCSATVVDSKRRNVLITAGHCVFGAEDETDTANRHFARNVIFVPGYGRSLNAPFGQFAAKWLSTTRAWTETADYRYDVAAIALNRPVQNETGARKIDFTADFTDRKVALYGYPVEPQPEYDGEDLIRCVPSTLGFDSWAEPEPHMARPCDMAQGASGGGWILDGKYLASVVSYGQSALTRTLFGPQFGAEAVGVYRSDRIGGSADPAVRNLRPVPRILKKRSINLRVGGSGSTPILFKVWLDRKPPVYTGSTIKVRRLRSGRHTVRIRSIDQTGHLSPKTVRLGFRVLPTR